MVNHHFVQPGLDVDVAGGDHDKAGGSLPIEVLAEEGTFLLKIESLPLAQRWKAHRQSSVPLRVDVTPRFLA